MKKGFILMSLVATLVIATGCCGCKLSGKASLKTLYGNDWSLVEINGNKEILRDQEDSYTLGFNEAEKRVYGKAACNRFFGTFEIEKRGEIDFGAMGSTKMACPNDNGEYPYFMMLDEADKYAIDDNKLILYDDNKVVAVFRAIPKMD